MLLRVTPFFFIIALSGCSSVPSGNGDMAKMNAPVTGVARTDKPLVTYSQGKSQLVPVNTVPSSNNLCVDHFNFLKRSGDDKYQEYSRQYIGIGNGFNFLNTNKNIMNADARRAYTNTLEMKLRTLCSQVNYEGFLIIQKKISEIGGV